MDPYIDVYQSCCRLFFKNTEPNYCINEEDFYQPLVIPGKYVLHLGADSIYNKYREGNSENYK